MTLCLLVCWSGDKPSYAQIAEWRRILHRLSFFLRSVDYLLLDLLHRLGLTALKMLLDHVRVSYDAGVADEEEVSVIPQLMMMRMILNTIARWFLTSSGTYRIWPNYRPCPHDRPPPDFLLYFHLLSPTWRSFSWLFTLFSIIIAHLTIFWH